MFTIYINYVNITEPITQSNPQCRPSRPSHLIKRDCSDLNDAYAFFTRVKQRAAANPDIIIVDYSIYNERKLVDMRCIAPLARYRNC